MHNLQNTYQAETWDEESIESTFRAQGLQLKSLERSPFFDLEFDLEKLFWVKMDSIFGFAGSNCTLAQIISQIGVRH